MPKKKKLKYKAKKSKIVKQAKIEQLEKELMQLKEKLVKKGII